MNSQLLNNHQRSDQDDDLLMNVDNIENNKNNSNNSLSNWDGKQANVPQWDKLKKDTEWNILQPEQFQWNEDYESILLDQSTNKQQAKNTSMITNNQNASIKDQNESINIGDEQSRSQRSSIKSFSSTPRSSVRFSLQNNEVNHYDTNSSRNSLNNTNPNENTISQSTQRKESINEFRASQIKIQSEPVNEYKTSLDTNRRVLIAMENILNVDENLNPDISLEEQNPYESKTYIPTKLQWYTANLNTLDLSNIPSETQCSDLEMKKEARYTANLLKYSETLKKLIIFVSILFIMLLIYIIIFVPRIIRSILQNK